jgi:predicted TIM-barrel fold metal-dependent hydrolase
VTLNGKFVIDCVTHAFDSRPENQIGGRYANSIIEGNFQFQWNTLPDPYRMPREQYMQAITPEGLASALFVESDTDVAIYHTIPAWGVFGDFSPVAVGMKIRAEHPGRMFIYGAASPLEGPKAVDDVVQQHAEWDILGVKLYPVDVIDGQMRTWSMRDEKLTYPVLQKCLDLGIKNIAIHKAIPLGTAPMDAFSPNDVDYPAWDFPDLNFEIVHGGFAFLEETAQQVARFSNIYVDLEGTSLFLINQPRAFAQILGALLAAGGSKKIFWSTGCSVAHPKPLLDAFEAFRMPRDLMEGYGYPEITDEIKADILANNYAALHGLDVPTLRKNIAGDELEQRRKAGPPAPWSVQPMPRDAVASAR